MYFLIKVLLISFLTTKCWTQSIVTIDIEEGKLEGLVSSTNTNKIYYSFLGIPYAQPPVGELRFQPPKAIEPWEGVVSATNYVNNICYQVNYDSDQESEDCLIVNVFTPNITCSDELYPVMFYIHGGGFTQGSAGIGEQLLIEQDVVIASVQYRLGPFGFLSTGDKVIPGNNGLKDQQLALQWAQKNLAHFCGDPKKVTIFGQSAGAASVTYQLLSPKSKGLFSAAICQSGAALSPWAYQRDQTSFSFKTAAQLNSNFSTSTNSTALLEYLLTVDAKDLDAASAVIYGQDNVNNTQIMQGFYYGPVIEVENDDAFITEYMYESFDSGNFSQVPVLLGINAEETVEWFNDEGMKWNMDHFTSNLSLFVPHDMHLTLENATLAGGEIKDFYNIYKNNTAYSNETLVNGIIFYSDTAFGRAQIKQAELLSKFVDCFFYIFSYYGKMGGWNGTVKGTGNVGHTVELNYLFNAYVDDKDTTVAGNFPEEDVTTQKRLVTLWSNFAKYNNPTPEKDELFGNVTWPKVTSSKIEYLDINVTLTAGTGPKGAMYKFWTALYDKYGVRPYDTY